MPSRPERDETGGPTRRSPGRRRLELAWIVAAAIALPALAELGTDGTKRMEHAYSVLPDRELRRVHVNHFVEHRGGGGWILLEHPVEACLRARGIDLDGWEGRLVGDRRRLRIDQRYRVAGREYRHRSLAALAKWARPELWNEPVRARIRLLEPLPADSS